MQCCIFHQVAEPIVLSMRASTFCTVYFKKFIVDYISNCVCSTIRVSGKKKKKCISFVCTVSERRFAGSNKRMMILMSFRGC